MARYWIASALAVALVAVPALAQIGNPAGMSPQSLRENINRPAPPPDVTNTTDQLFTRLLSAGGLAEVDLGQLAVQQSASDIVRAFAGRLVEDHSSANDRLASVAEDHGIVLPNELSQDHRVMRETLEPLSGREFDIAYVAGQVVEHQRALHLLEWEIASGQAPPLKAFAEDMLPTVYEHLQAARALLIALRTSV